MRPVRAYAGLATLAVLWLTWPDAQWAALGIFAFGLAAYAVYSRRANLAILALSLGVLTAATLPAHAFALRAWGAAGILILTGDAILRTPAARDARDALVWSAVLLGALCVAAVLARFWRPLASSLSGDDGNTVALLLLAGIGAALTLALRGEGDRIRE